MNTKLIFLKKLAILCTVLFVNAALFAGSTEPEKQQPAPGEKLKVIGWLQPQFQMQFDHLNGESASLTQNTFSFNRARLGVTGNVAPGFSYFMMADFSSFKGGPVLVKATISWDGLGHWAKLTAGKFKNQFGLELCTSSRELKTINRSEVVDKLTSPLIDYGIMVSGGSDNLKFWGLDNKDILKYSLALMNGSGKNVYDADIYKDVIFRLNFSPFPYISLGGSFRDGKRKNPEDSNQPVGYALRYGLDIEVNYENFLIQGEYIKARDKSYTQMENESNNVSFTSSVLNSDGYFVQALYLLPINLQPVIKYESFSEDLNGNFDPDHAITVGFNYFINDATRLQLNYVHAVSDNKTIQAADKNNLSDAVYMQLQLVF